MPHYQPSVISDVDRIETTELMLRLANRYLERGDAACAEILLDLAAGILTQLELRADFDVR
jgi:hypothetical protein